MVHCLRKSRRRSDNYESLNTSRLEASSATINKENGDDASFSAEALAMKLDEMRDSLTKNTESIELQGFNVKEASETAEEYLRRREEIRGLLADPVTFDECSKTVLNYDAAAIAGAKILIDQTRATRSMSRKLADGCGIDEGVFLYSGLNNCRDKGARELIELRKASVVESFVDFHKQIQFKMSVLKHVAEKTCRTSNSKSDPRLTYQQRVDAERALAKAVNKKNRKLPVPKTPRKNTIEINPLDEKKIIECYALEVASEVAYRSKRRKIAAIPFNIHLLDEED